MENQIIISNDTNLEELFSAFTNAEQVAKTSYQFDSAIDVEKVKQIIQYVSDLPDDQFKYVDMTFKKLSTEAKAEVLKYAINNNICITNLIETIVLFINSSNNYNNEFFESDKVFFNSLVDYLDICDEVEEEINTVREKIGYYFLATIKSYVNHPRFILMENSNSEMMPKMYECILLLLDIFNISFILNTPNLNIPDFASIPNNVKNSMSLIDLWTEKQKFVISSLSELSKLIHSQKEDEDKQ